MTIVANPLNSSNLVTFGPTLNANSNEMSGDISEISLALSKAQGELESANKGTQGYGYSYSDLNQVINTAKPILAKHGLAVTQLVNTSGDKDLVSVTTILTHESGQFFRSVGSIPIVDMKGVNQAQKIGASISYLRRYAYQAILGMASEDNDASSHGLDKPKNKTSFKKETKTTEEKPQKFRRKKKESTEVEHEI